MTTFKLTDKQVETLKCALDVYEKLVLTLPNSQLDDIIYDIKMARTTLTENDDDLSCSRCGCMPGDGRTDECDDTEGCGYNL